MVDHPYDPTLDRDDGQGSHNDSRDGERVAKVLARAGVASRRDVERLIEAGRVAVNGRTLTTPAVKVGAGDIVTLDGDVVSEAEPTRLWRYHKPAGLLTSHKDPQGRPTVFDNLPADMPRVISIGRLDLSSEGLLLLTNDGALSRALELPTTGWVRRYRARAHGRITQESLDRLKDGITVEGVHYGSIEARLDKAKEGPQGANVWISVAITEGKNREVRRVLEAVGLKVNRLLRLSYGPFQLGALASGAVEEVGPRVIREQLEGLIAPENMPKGDRVPKPGPVAPARRPSLARPTEAVEAPKKTYKAGWAKPKVKAGPRHKVTGKPKPKPEALTDSRVKTESRVKTDPRAKKPAAKSPPHPSAGGLDGPSGARPSPGSRGRSRPGR
jgi:23S rRNA pseudouridine2605 synthase